MRRRKRNHTSIRFGMAVLVFLFIMAGIRIIFLKGEEVEVFQGVKESDLSEMFNIKSEKDKMQKSDEAIDEDKRMIRVLIMGNGYSSETHAKVILSSDSRMCIVTEEEKEYIKAGEQIVLEPDDKRFDSGNVRITSEKKIQLNHLERGYGTPSYEGVIELQTTAEGIVIVNELPVEKYLKAVVPSEMPASYELEALKAQAVCARSYAYRQLEEYGYPEYHAHVNDSTDYQVYGNSEPQKSTNQAIKETSGQVVYYQGKIATTYYYSTSCGKTTDMGAWGTKKTKDNAYLKAVQVKGNDGDYEKNLAWYKWKAEVPIEILSNLIGINTKKDIGLLKNIKVTKRGGGDIAIEIKAIGENGNLTVKTENKIRAVLGGSGYQITLNDGTVTESRELLPSAFFTIKKTGDIFVIEGGGFGHGIGMSQNGANEMAKKGKDYREILEFFYQDVEIR